MNERDAVTAGLEARGCTCNPVVNFDRPGHVDIKHDNQCPALVGYDQRQYMIIPKRKATP